MGLMVDITSTWSDTRPSDARRSSADRRAPSRSSVDDRWATQERRAPTGSLFQEDNDRRLPTPNAAAAPRREPPAATRYKTGQKVRHAKFGDGTVIESKLSGDDEEVTVAFPGIGIKRLAASFAKLEVIG